MDLNALSTRADTKLSSRKWEIEKLQDCCDLIRDGTHTPPKRVDSGIPLLTAKNIKNGRIDFNGEVTYIAEEDYKSIHRNFSALRGDVLLTIVGTIGRTAIVDTDRRFSLQRSVCILRPSREKLDSSFLFHALNSTQVQNQLRLRAKTTAQSGVYLRDIAEVRIPIPPLAEQKRVVGVLERVRKLEEMREQANQLTGKVIQSIFLKMFGDLATNPKGWKATTIGDHARIRYGTGSPPPYEERGIPFVRATNIKMGKIITQEMKFISPESAKQIEKCRLHEGNLLIVRSGVNTGDCAYVTREYEGSYAAYDLILDFHNDLDSRFVWGILNMSYGRTIMKPMTVRSAQPHLNAVQVSSIKVPKPPVELQQKFASFVEKLDTLSERQTESTHEIDELFHSLMQKAFRGELRLEKHQNQV